MKNAIYSFKKSMSVIWDGSKLFIIFTEYLFDTKKGVLSGYRLYPVDLKGNNNRGKEVNFKGRKAKCDAQQRIIMGHSKCAISYLPQPRVDHGECPCMVQSFSN